MSQTMTPALSSFAPSVRTRMIWATPGDGLWVATRAEHGDVQFVGFVEQSLGDYVAVDGHGASMGRHEELAAAQHAVERGVGSRRSTPRAWSETDARVLDARALRAR